MSKIVSFIVGLMMGIILTVGSIIGIPLYILNNNSLSDVENMTGTDMGLFDDEEDTDGVMQMSILELLSYTNSLLEGDEDGKLTLEGLSKKLGFSSKLPAEFQPLYTMDLNAMKSNPEQASTLLMDSITIDMIMTMSKMNPNDGAFGSMLAGISDMSLSSLLSNVENLPIGVLVGLTPTEYYDENSAIVEYYQNNFGYMAPTPSDTPDDLNDMLKKLLFKVSDTGEYIVYIIPNGPNGEANYAYLKYEALHVTNDTARYSLESDGTYKMLKDPDLTDTNLFVKVRGQYISVEDANALYVLYSTTTRYNATDISAMSDMEGVVGDIALGDIASMIGLEDMPMLQSLMHLTIAELGSNPDVFDDIEIATLLGEQIPDQMMSKILLKNMTTTPLVGDKVWVDVAGVMTYVEVTADTLNDYDKFYQSVTLGELTDGGFSDMTLAQFMPDIDDDMFIKLLYRELAPDYEYTVDEVVYIRGTDGKMVEIVYVDATSIPAVTTVYKALTLAELTGGIDLNGIISDIEIASFLGDKISDGVMTSILFTKLTAEPTIGDKVWIDNCGEMQYVTVDANILNDYDKFYRSLTVGELSSVSFEDMALAQFMPDVDDDILIKVLYRELASDYEYTVDEIVYTRGADGKMVEIVYVDATSIPAGEKVYKAITLRELTSGIDINGIIQDIEIAPLLGDEISDDILSKILFEKLTTKPVIGDKVWVEESGVMKNIVVNDIALSTHTVFYRAITMSELSSSNMSDITLAQFMPDVDDDILIKVLYRELAPDYEYTVDEVVYTRGADGKMVEIVYVDDTSIPADTTVYKALTLAELTGGIDLNGIISDIEVASFLGDKITDKVMTNILFEKLTAKPAIGDKVWVDKAGEMHYVTVDADVLNDYDKFYRSLTIGELSNASFEDITLAEFMPSVDDDILIQVLYRELASDYEYTVDEVVYTRGADGKMIEIVYVDDTSIPAGEQVYKAITLKELSNGIDMDNIIKDIEIAPLLGDEISDDILSKILFEKLATTPLVGDKVWVEVNGVMKRIVVDSTILSTHTVFYRAITMSELSSNSMDDMTLAEFMPDVDDDILIKVLYRELAPDYEYSVDEVVYTRGADGKMVEIVYADATSIPAGESVYKALTFSQFINDGVDIDSILKDVEVAPLMGDDGVSDTLFIEIVFDELANNTLKVGDKVYRLESGVMKAYTIASSQDLNIANVYYKSKTVSELMGTDLENMHIVKFMNNSADDLMLSILYEKVLDNSTLVVGDTVYYKDAGVMEETKYDTSMSTMTLYKGVSIKDFANIDITDKVKSLSIAGFLMNSGLLTDETLIDIVFDKLDDAEYSALNGDDEVFYKDLEGMHKTTKSELDNLNSTKPSGEKYSAYSAMSMSDFSTLDMNAKVKDMELARYLLDNQGMIKDDMLEKLLFSEANSQYIATLGAYDMVYVKTAEGIKRVPLKDANGQTIYKALTVSELSSGMDIEGLIDDMQIASLMGDEVSDTLFVEILFDKVSNDTLKVGDEVYRLESGVMKAYTIASNQDLNVANVYYKSKTVREFLDTDIDGMPIVKFMNNSADDMVVSILYNKVLDNSTLVVGDTVYYKDAGVMVEAKYDASMSTMALYKGVSIEEFGSINITDRVKNISIAKFLSTDGTVTDETLMSIVFSVIPSEQYALLSDEEVVYYKDYEGMHEITKGALDVLNEALSVDQRYTPYSAMTLSQFANLDMNAKVKEIEIARYLVDNDGKVAGDLMSKMLFRQVDAEYVSSLGAYDMLYVEANDGSMQRIRKSDVGSQTVYRSLTMSELTSIDIKDLVNDMQVTELIDITPDSMLANIFMTKYTGALVEGEYYYVKDNKYVKYIYPTSAELDEGTVLYTASKINDLSTKMENIHIMDMVDVKPDTLMSAIAYEELEGDMKEGVTYYYIDGDTYTKYTGNTLPEYPLYRPRTVKESSSASENLLVRDIIDAKPGTLMANIAYKKVSNIEAGHTYYYVVENEFRHFNYTGREDYSSLGQMYVGEKMTDMPTRMTNLSLTDVLGEPERKDFYNDGVLHYTGIWAIFEKADGSIDDIKLTNLNDEISSRISIDKITLGTMERLQGKVIEGLDDGDRAVSVKVLIDWYLRYKDFMN